MTDKFIKSRCLPNCPKVKEQIRAAIAEAPWLLEEAFLKEKDATKSPLPEVFTSKEIRDKSKPEIDVEVTDKITVNHHEKIKTVAEAAEKIQEPTIIQKSRIDQEETIIEEYAFIPTEKIPDHDDREIDLVKEERLVIEKTFPVTESIKETPVIGDKHEIIDDKINEISTEFEMESLQEYAVDTDFELKEHTDYIEDEGVTDYDRFIDEELQESLTTTKETLLKPKEVVGEIMSTLPAEYPIKAKPLVREEPDISSRDRQIESHEPVHVVSANAEDRQTVKNDRMEVRKCHKDICDETCPLVNEQKERIMRKLRERQRIIDHYYLTKDFNYFEDVCTCSLACVLHTLSRDPFVRNIFASLTLFAIGLKLCSELDAWEMPSRVS